MFKKSKLLVILIALALIPATASATITRVIGFGGAQAAFVVKDASNPVEFPSTLAYYPHILYAEFAPGASNTYLDRIGAWYGFGEDKCVLGVDVFQRNKLTYAPQLMGDNLLPYRLNLRWARPFGSVILGAALGIYHDSRKTTGDTLYTDPDYHEVFHSNWTSDEKATILGLDLGVTALNKNLDASVGFEFPSGKSEATYALLDTNMFYQEGAGHAVVEDDGSSMLRFLARYWYHYGERTTLIPNFELRTTKNAYTVLMTQSDTSNYYYSGWRGWSSGDYSRTSTVVRLGLGHNWKPADNVLVVFDVGVRFESVKSEWDSESREATDYLGDWTDTLVTGEDYNADWTDLPYWRLGWEGQVLKWLKLRGGAEKIWRARDEDDKFQAFNPRYNWNYGDHHTLEAGETVTNMYFGGDFFFGPVVIQYLMDQDFVRRGPYFISGEPGALFHRFSLFYKIPK